MPKTISVLDAARALSIGKTKAYQLLAEQRLRSIRIGRRRLVIADSIDELIAASAEAAQ